MREFLGKVGYKMATADELDLKLGEIIRIDSKGIIQILKRENEGGIVIQYLEAENKIEIGSREYISKNYNRFTRIEKHQ